MTSSLQWQMRMDVGFCFLFQFLRQQARSIIVYVFIHEHRLFSGHLFNMLLKGFIEPYSTKVVFHLYTSTKNKTKPVMDQTDENPAVHYEVRH